MTRSVVPRLHLIGPLAVPTPGDYVSIAARAASGGCDAVHVRVPGKPGRDVLKLATAVREQIAGTPVALIVNDRIDVAMLVGADGIQLGERSIDVRDARRLVGDGMLIGRSIHDVEGATRAERDGADYLLAGHIFETNSKAGQAGRGLEWLREIVAAVRIPVIAIGGISIDRIDSVMQAGAHGVAMGRELLHADDPERIARAATRNIEEMRGR